MGTLVLNRQSLSVKLESEHLVVHDHVDGSLRRVPLVNVDRVVVCGEPAITFPVLAELMDRGIPCSFLKPSGLWRGKRMLLKYFNQRFARHFFLPLLSFL